VFGSLKRMRADAVFPSEEAAIQAAIAHIEGAIVDLVDHLREAQAERARLLALLAEKETP